jgi:hypothetical protein
VIPGLNDAHFHLFSIEPSLSFFSRTGGLSLRHCTTIDGGEAALTTLAALHDLFYRESEKGRSLRIRECGLIPSDLALM